MTFSSSVKPVIFGSRRSRTMQSKGACSSSAASASSDEPTATISTSPSPPTSSMIDVALRLVVVDDEQAADVPVDEGPDPAEDLVERLQRGRLLQEGGRARGERGAQLADAGDDVHRDVARRRMPLQPVEHRPAVEHRQAHVEHDRVGPELAREREARVAAERDDALEPVLARDRELGLGEVRVVLDDQHDTVAGLDRLAVVGDLALDEQGRVEQRRVELRRVAVAAARRVDARSRSAAAAPSPSRPARARRSAPAGRA